MESSPLVAFPSTPSARECKQGTMGKLTKITHRLAIAAALLATGGLLAEGYANQAGKSLCHTSACAIVTKFVRLGEPLLLSLGAGMFLLLAAFIFFAGRYAKQPMVRFLPILTLIGAAAFDGALLGFQFITLRQHCQLCISVAIALGLVTLLYSASLRNWTILLSVLTAWTAGFLANAILIMPDTTEAHSGMIFYERPAAKEFAHPPVATLIFSLECPHCTMVLEAMAKQNLHNITWRFAITDTSFTSYEKLGLFYAEQKTTTNPFQLLIESKKSQQAKLTDNKLLKKFPELTRQARSFLANNGLNAVPVLVFKEPNDKITIIPGSPEIIEFLGSIKP